MSNKIEGKYTGAMLDPMNRAVYRSLMLHLRRAAQSRGFTGTWEEMVRVLRVQGVPVSPGFLDSCFRGGFYGMLGLDVITALIRGYSLPVESVFSPAICEAMRDELENPTTSLTDPRANYKPKS